MRRIVFETPDPLGGGLAEEIIAEQQSPDAITLNDEPDGDSLAESWNRMVSDLHKDPTWFDDFAQD